MLGWLSDAACWASARNRARKRRVAGVLAAEHLHRDRPVQGDVGRPPDLAHAAGGDQLVQLVAVAQAPSSWFDHGGHSSPVRLVRAVHLDTAGGSAPITRTRGGVHSGVRLHMLNVRAGRFGSVTRCDPCRLPARSARRLLRVPERPRASAPVSRRRASGPTSRRRPAGRAGRRRRRTRCAGCTRSSRPAAGCAAPARSRSPGRAGRR